MRVSRILSRSIAREILAFSALGLFSVGALLLAQNLLRELSDLTAVGLTTRDLLTLAGCLAGMLAAYAMPVAFLFGVLVTVARLSADSEVLAMRALGIGLGGIAIPVLLLALLASAASALLLAELDPAARRELRAVAAQIAARGGFLKPGRFRSLDSGGLRLLLVDAHGQDNRIEGVFLADRSDPARPFTVTAERGRFELDPDEGTARLLLEQGDIDFEDVVPGSGAHRRIAFARFDYAWDLSARIGADLEQLRPRELGMARLREALDHFEAHGEAPSWARTKEESRYRVQLHRRLALAAAPLVLALLALPLGLRRTRGARSFGALACGLLALSYYALLTAGTALAEEGRVPVPAGLWLPNAVFTVMALGLLWRARGAES